MALVITAIASVDPICCADGCTRTDFAASNHSSPRTGDCPICQPGAVALIPAVIVASLEPTSTALPTDRIPPASIPRVIERPPRP
ncbi:MAG: hypothetical protein ABJA98_17095 [Acidobacteriota bacterium]